MFFAKSNTVNVATKNADKLAAQARMAGAAAAQSAASAAQTATAAAQTATAAAQEMGSRAQVATAGMRKGARQGVYTARSWAAPRLDDAADYWAGTLAPKVAEALRASARQVRPKPARRTKALTWALLTGAALAAAGAAGALVRYRYRAAMTASSGTDAASPAARGTESAASADRPAAAVPGQDGPATSGPDTPVNGRVSAS